MHKVLILLLTSCTITQAISWKLTNASDVNVKFALYTSGEDKQRSYVRSKNVPANTKTHLELKSMDKLRDWEIIKIYKLRPNGVPELIALQYLVTSIRYPNFGEVTLVVKDGNYAVEIAERTKKASIWQ